MEEKLFLWQSEFPELCESRVVKERGEQYKQMVPHQNEVQYTYI